MIKVINAQPGIAVPLTEKDTKSFLTGNNNLLIRVV
jgi:hypothetical protein